MAEYPVSRFSVDGFHLLLVPVQIGPIGTLGVSVGLVSVGAASTMLSLGALKRLHTTTNTHTNTSIHCVLVVKNVNKYFCERWQKHSGRFCGLSRSSASSWQAFLVLLCIPVCCVFLELRPSPYPVAIEQWRLGRRAVLVPKGFLSFLGLCLAPVSVSLQTGRDLKEIESSAIICNPQLY